MRKGSFNHDRTNMLRARKLRLDMSVSEKRLWAYIRKDRLGFSFRRQVPIGEYVLDFYCAKAALCVEVDGEQHAPRAAADRRRDLFLKQRGIETMRIPSLDLFEPTTIEFSKWLDKLEALCRKRAGLLHPLTPLLTNEPK